MTKYPWTPSEIDQAVKMFAEGVPLKDIAAKLGRTTTAVRLQANRQGVRYGCKRSKGFTVGTIPTPTRSLNQIIQDQSERHQEKKARWESKHQGIPITLEDDGPYAIVFFGDPHADDDGCDLEKLSYDLNLVATNEHVYGANMGDLTNNWIRALGHLYAHQHTTDDEATELMDWLIGAIDWLFVILGNHDKWGPLAARICKEKEVTYVSHGAMFRFDCGGRILTIDARHTHKGHSQYNPSFAQAKKNYRGSPADIIIGAHIHTSAYTMLKNGQTGQIGHAIRVGAYKKFDEYADQHGFDEETISPSVMAVVDPGAPPEGYVTIFHDVDAGLRFLNALRSE